MASRLARDSVADGTDGSMWPVTGALGAIFAAASVAIARRPAPGETLQEI